MVWTPVAKASAGRRLIDDSTLLPSVLRRAERCQNPFAPGKSSLFHSRYHSPQWATVEKWLTAAYRCRTFSRQKKNSANLTLTPRPIGQQIDKLACLVRRFGPVLPVGLLERTPARLPRMDRNEILTRLALILRRMHRLADLAARDKQDVVELRKERERLHGKWQELAQQLRQLHDAEPPDEYRPNPRTILSSW